LPLHLAALTMALLTLSLVACNLPGLPPTPTPTPTLTPTPTPTPTPTVEPADTGWETMEEGVEVRQVRVVATAGTERLSLVRLDPAQFRFRVLYTPGEAQRVSEWAAGTDASASLLIVNGGYFTPEYYATGLLVSDGQTYGVSHGDFAGAFVALPGGRVQVRWLTAQPYDPQEMLVAAVQSFPVLVKPGGVMGFPAGADDGRPARRTVVAQDRTGRILFAIAPRGFLSLHELACWLAESDLDLDVALNLDGGTSSGLILQTETGGVRVDSLGIVPAVIVAYR
jgi:uncharacterized protein YigE (DUF2233 family)